jgi:phosphatidylglycerophosphatase A
VHFVLNNAAARYWDDPDSGNFVMDEVAGYLLTAILAHAFLPMSATPWILIEGFLLFRVLDIVKLPPARQIDRNWHNAFGVILDDLVSAAYAAGLLVLQLRLMG